MVRYRVIHLALIFEDENRWKVPVERGLQSPNFQSLERSVAISARLESMRFPSPLRPPTLLGCTYSIFVVAGC